MPYDPEDLRRTREEDMKNTSLPPSLWGVLPAEAPDGESSLTDDLDADRFCQYCDETYANGEYPEPGELTVHMKDAHPDIYGEKITMHYAHPGYSTDAVTE